MRRGAMRDESRSRAVFMRRIDRRGRVEPGLDWDQPIDSDPGFQLTSDIPVLLSGSGRLLWDPRFDGLGDLTKVGP